ncbi:MAG: Rne/Rng family ribonuclease [Thermoanaerobaculia bacterium]
MRRMLIDANPYRVRVAMLVDGTATDVMVERADRRGVVGNVYKGRVKRVLPGIEAAFVDIGLERDAYLQARDAVPEESDVPAALAPTRLPGAGEDVLVQVRRDPLPGKGARVTPRISLPGRFVVWFPCGAGGGISRRIDDAEERARLAGLADALGDAPGALIVRTAGVGQEIDALRADLAALRATWTEIQDQARRAAAPALLRREEGLAVRAVRDLFRDDVDELLVDGEEAHAEVKDYVDRRIPQLVDRVHRFERPGFLFDELDVERVFSVVVRQRVPLPAGGHLVIQPTEALVAIDVNSGTNVGRADLEATALATNLEAAREIPRQLRLRDLGGIIVVDFIDMERDEARREVLAALVDGLRADPQRSRVLDFSDFGLVQITRRRARVDVARLLTDPCGTCRGRGRVSAALGTLVRLRRDLLHGALAREAWGIAATVHPEILAALDGDHRALKSELEERWEGRLEWTASSELDREAYRLDPLS